MITLHTINNIPETILQEAQEKADLTGQTHYLAYLKAGKDEPLTLVTSRPSIGLAAQIEPEQLAIYQRILQLCLASGATLSSSRLDQPINPSYKSDTGEVELIFDNHFPHELQTRYGSYHMPISTFGDGSTFLTLLNTEFDVTEIEPIKFPELTSAIPTGPVYSLKPKQTNDEILRFLLVGDDNQLNAIEAALRDITLPVIRRDRELGFLAKHETLYKSALIWIFDKRIDGWWNQQYSLIEHKICSQAQFEAAFYSGLIAKT